MATDAGPLAVLTPVVVGGLHPSMTRLLLDLRVSLAQTQRLRREVARERAGLKPGVDQALAALTYLLTTRFADPKTLDSDTVGQVAALVQTLVATQERYARMQLQLAKATDADARLHQLLSGEPDSRSSGALDDLSDAELERLVRAAHARLEAPRPAVSAGAPAPADPEPEVAA